jgi:hypothetical protein
MADSKRLRIIKAVVTQLSGITVANGYHSNVASVKHGARIIFGTPPDEMPAIDVHGGPGDGDEDPDSTVVGEFDITCLGAVPNGDDGQKDLDAAENLIADIKNRMAESPTLGGLAINARATGDEDVDAQYWVKAICEVVIRVRYTHGYGSA